VDRTKHLGIYLNDHLAGAMAGRELARRCLANNGDSALGTFLEELLRDIEEDTESLTGIMDRLAVGRSPWKPQAAWVAEKVGRLKMNGRLLGYSDLSRVEELEALLLAITGKLTLWRSLEVIAAHEPKLERSELSVLAERAEQQFRKLEGHHRDALELAFGKEDLSTRATENEEEGP
jgi:hypothetical protein